MKHFTLEVKEIVLLHSIISNHLFNYNSGSYERILFDPINIRLLCYWKLKKIISIEGNTVALLYNIVYQELHNPNTIFNIDLLTKLENRFNKFIFITID